MVQFTLSPTTHVVCETKSRRGGFKHEAVLLRNGGEIAREKQLWVNRTWEAFHYQSVLRRMLDSHSSELDADEKARLESIIASPYGKA